VELERWCAVTLALVGAACGSAATGASADGGAGADGNDGIGGGGSWGTGGGEAVDARASPSDAAAPGVPVHIEMVSGNGAALLESWPGGTITVRVTDGVGAPVSGVDVTWSLVSGEGVNITSPGQPTSQTDHQGLASRMLQGVGFSASSPFGQGVVRASAAVGSVDFVAVTVHGTSAGPIGPYLVMTEPKSLDLGKVKAGSLLPLFAKLEAAVQAGVFSGTPLPNVGLRFVDGSDPELPESASCVGGSVLTDANGHAWCDLRIGTELGHHSIAALAGETSVFSAIHFEVIP
jgi:hypothetical protein